MKKAESQIRAKVDAFVGDLTKLIQQAVLEAVTDSIGKGGRPAPRPARAAKAAPAPAAKRAAGRPAAKASAKSRKKGEKRSGEEIAMLMETVFSHVRSNPDQGVEAMAKALGMSTQDLNLPIRKLIADKRITAKGQKRATKYSVK